MSIYVDNLIENCITEENLPEFQQIGCQELDYCFWRHQNYTEMYVIL